MFVSWIMYIWSENLIALWRLRFKLFDYWSIKRRIQFIRFAAHSFQNFSDNVTSVSVATFLTIITSMSDSVHYLFIIIHRAQLRIQSIIQIRNNRILVITRPTISMLIIDDAFACIRIRFGAWLDVSRTEKRAHVLNWDVTAPVPPIIATISAVTFCDVSQCGVPCRSGAPRVSLQSGAVLTRVVSGLFRQLRGNYAEQTTAASSSWRYKSVSEED